MNQKQILQQVNAIRNRVRKLSASLALEDANRTKLNHYLDEQVVEAVLKHGTDGQCRKLLQNILDTMRKVGEHRWVIIGLGHPTSYKQFVAVCDRLHNFLLIDPETNSYVMRREKADLLIAAKVAEMKEKEKENKQPEIPPVTGKLLTLNGVLMAFCDKNHPSIMYVAYQGCPICMERLKMYGKDKS